MFASSHAIPFYALPLLVIVLACLEATQCSSVVVVVDLFGSVGAPLCLHVHATTAQRGWGASLLEPSLRYKHISSTCTSSNYSYPLQSSSACPPVVYVFPFLPVLLLYVADLFTQIVKCWSGFCSGRSPSELRILTDSTAVLSGDTVIVRPKEAPEKGKPAKER